MLLNEKTFLYFKSIYLSQILYIYILYSIYLPVLHIKPHVCLSVCLYIFVSLVCKSVLLSTHNLTTYMYACPSIPLCIHFFQSLFFSRFQFLSLSLSLSLSFLSLYRTLSLSLSLPLSLFLSQSLDSIYSCLYEKKKQKKKTKTERWVRDKQINAYLYL